LVFYLLLIALDYICR